MTQPIAPADVPKEITISISLRTWALLRVSLHAIALAEGKPAQTIEELASALLEVATQEYGAVLLLGKGEDEI